MPRTLSRTEFVALMATLFATIAFSIDSMLPALPKIAAELSPETPNHAQLILTSFIFGMGIGTFFTGALSDAFGRKPVIVAGAALYILATLLAWMAGTLELMLAARVLQGLGASGPRVVALAIIRDLYEGRGMAQLMSFVMLVFTLFPAVAPLMGTGIIALAGWRAIFGVFVLFSLVSAIWLMIRQDETLPPERRRPLRWTLLRGAVTEVLSNRHAALTIVALSLIFGMLFVALSTTQPVFEKTFGRAGSFPYYFALIAGIAATGNILNARIVMVFGMRRVAKAALLGQVLLSAAMLAYAATLPWDTPLAFPIFIAWTAGVFSCVGLTVGNLNALAMVPMGHIAGMASSIIGALSTVASVLIAAPIGLAFDGTPLPGVIGVLVCAILAFLTVRALGEPAPIGATDP